MAKVLVVDDEVPLVQLLAEVIRDSGHDVLTAHNGQEAFALAQRTRPDLVITDVMMPLMTGYELLAAIRTDPDLQATPVVVLSAVARPPPPPVPPADVYLAKPFDLEAIEDLIHHFIPS